MATTKKQIGYGSQGSEVSELQNTLNQNGYNLSVDGIFGKNTLNAVKDYQQKQGLSVDGIVGTQTWGALGGNKSQATTSPTTTSPTTTNQSPTTVGNKYSNVDLSKYASGYTESDAVKSAGEKKDTAEQAVSNFGDFTYSNQKMYDDVIGKILNREKFSYDLNGDALYQQYKDSFVQQGKIAMQDTMGQAAMMTGGYGNSYAQSVGNQAYQASLQQLNDKIPELYQMAYDKYKQEGQDMINQFGILDSQRSTEYGEWGDRYNKAVADRDYAANDYNNAYAKEYGEWSDSYNRDTTQYWNETNFGYGQERDAVADAQYNESAAYSKAMAYIQAGIVPSEDILKTAGLDSESAKSLAEKYKDSSSGNGVKVSDSGITPSQHTEMMNTIDDYIADENVSGLQNYLNTLVNRGWLTDKEAKAIFLPFYEEEEEDSGVKIDKDKTNYSGSGGGGGRQMHVLN